MAAGLSLAGRKRRLREQVTAEFSGKELRVFGEAPGGWNQIGATEANGWVHNSLVQRR